MLGTEGGSNWLLTAFSRLVVNAGDIIVLVAFHSSSGEFNIILSHKGFPVALDT